MLSQKEIEEYKKNAKKIPVSVGDDIGEILKKLEELHNEGKYNYYVEIYGKRAYSADINYKEDFKRIVGISEDELKVRIERANLEDEIRQQEIASDAKALLDYRKIAGKRQIEPAKHELWEELVEKYSQPPYFTDAIDSIIKYLEFLNSDYTLEEIITKLNEQYGRLGDWYTSGILSNLAKFHRRGIRLFELIREFARENGEDIAEDQGYFESLRKINEYLDLGCSYPEAQNLASIKPANIKISDIDHEVLINDDMILGIKPDYFILGCKIDEDFVLYMIEGTKVNSYLCVGDETIEKYVDGTIGSTINKRLDIEYTDKSLKEIKDEYEKIISSYNNQDIKTIMDVYKELLELEQSINISEEENIPAIKAVFQQRKEKIHSLTKSTN